MNPSRHPLGLLARTLCRAALALPLMLGAAAAHATSIADVVNSSGGSWGGAGNNTWTPMAAGSVVSAAEVNGKLVAASHVKVFTHTADPALVVKAALTLAAASHLELSSHRDITIQAPVQAAGASVRMRLGQGSVAAGNTANIVVSAPVHLSTSSTYTTLLGSDGVDISHTIITSLGLQGSNSGTDLQGMAGDLAGHYVLGADIDASETSGWNGGDGFSPVGIFTGSMDGLGHTIEGLTIKRQGNSVGLFGEANGALLRNIGLVDVEISGQSSVGGLVGMCEPNCTISSSYATGNVSANGFAGGLVGLCQTNCTISSSYATGSASVQFSEAGGLVGLCYTDCTIISSYSTGSASAPAQAGGLVGLCYTDCTIISSYSTGSASAQAHAGGLIGMCYTDCTIISSYATGSASAQAAAGGLVGLCVTNCSISSSFYATTDSGGSPINNGGGGGGAWHGNAHGIPKTLSELKSLTTFTTAGWGIDDAGGTGTTWRIYDGRSTPLLRSLLTPLTIANLASKFSDGTTAVAIIYAPASPDASRLGSATAQASSSAVGGPHTVTIDTSGLLYHQRGYDITLAPQAVTIYAVTAPGAPTAGAAVPGNAQATVSWTAPASDGGSAIISYTVTGTPAGSCTVAAPATTCVVNILANGTPYTFTVKATNAVGDSLPSLASAPVTPTAPVVIAPPAEDPGPTSTTINTPGSTTTITNPSLPVVVGPGAGGGTIVLPGTGTTPVTLQVIVNGQPLTVQALPGTQLRIAEVNGQSVLVLVVLEGWASMASSAAGQPMVLAGPVLLSSGSAGTTVEAQPLAVAVQVGSLTAPAGSLTALGSMGLQAGERLQVSDQGAVVAITLGSLKGDTNQPGDPMAFANLPASLTVDNEAFARLNGPLSRLSGANMAQGLEVAPSGVFLVRDGGQVFQLLPTQPITIDARLPDGMDFTPLGLLRWVRGGVVVQFAPAVADLAGLAGAVTAALPDATLKLGAEGVLQLRTGGQTYVLKPDWTGAGTATGTPQIGVDEQGRIYLQTGQGARQWLLPALLNATQASSIVTTALPGAVLAVQPGSSTGALTLTLAGQAWRLVPQWLLPSGSAAQVPPQAGPWWMGSDGLLYLKLGTQVQGVRISD